ncbi:hypothetical protein [Streptomyces sp. SID10815]|uniref:hypothetical protein n=1 Tax=Streptomyces sp. SID10815 TaxID=2706027 RepID=UPI0013CBA7F5|nr:hypothetical protein [Streptomyces sp. SID10815]NEA48430.1 hypothetical protein [Streptomyces sp. SID10815]
MPTITALLAHAMHAPAPAQAPYEDWRPPIHGVSLLIPVGADALVVADLRGLIMLPAGTVSDGQTPEQAAQGVLLGAPDGLPALQRVACIRKQLRRRKVITHVLATQPMTREAVAQLVYRDPRADLRVLPSMRVLGELTPAGQLRVLTSLQALAIGETAHIDEGMVCATAPSDLRAPRSLSGSTGLTR